MRLFLGVPLPGAARYAETTQDLALAFPGARPVPVGSWHVTLRFLGEVADPAPVAAVVAPAVARHASSDLEVRGVGAFPKPAKARVVWAGVHAPGLERLARDVVAVTPLQHDPDAERPFHAHATLARLDPARDVRTFVEAHRETAFAIGRLAEVVLFQSQLTPRGPVYERVATFPLAP